MTLKVTLSVMCDNITFFRNFSHYKQRFSMPGGTEGMFYSYNLGLAHIISINTEAYYYPQYGSDQILTQYNWLNKDLQVCDRYTMMVFCV